MKVLLIYPPRVHYMFAESPHTSIEPETGFYPPIGLLYLAAYLEKHTDTEVYVLDSYTDGLTHIQVTDYIRKIKPDIVGIYISTFYLYDGILVAKNVKSVAPEIITVAGGPHVALYPRETVAVPEIDYVMVGESEISFTRLVNYIVKHERENIDTLSNTLSKNSPVNKVVCREHIVNLDELPFPSRYLVNYKKYKSVLAKRNPITTVITSRGCPFNCYFCSNLESAQRVRYRSAGNVVRELKDVVTKLQIYDFLFFDELFTSNRQRVTEICDEIIKNQLHIRWHCRSRADVLDEPVIKIMRQAGCRLIQFGIETGSPRIQKYVNKNLNLTKVSQVLTLVRDYGIQTYADFIVGLPTETEDETSETIDLALRLPLDYAVFGMFGPMYGSVFYEQGIKEGRFTDFWREFVANPQVPIADTSWTKHDAQKYFTVISTAYRQFYFRPEWMVRRLLATDSLVQLTWQIKSGVKVFTEMFRRFRL